MHKKKSIHCSVSLTMEQSHKVMLIKQLNHDIEIKTKMKTKTRYRNRTEKSTQQDAKIL